MKRNFVQVTQFLEKEFPALKGRVTGELFPPPPAVELAAHILSAMQMLGLVWMVMGGDKLLRMIGFRQLPSFYWTVNENPVPFAIGLYLLAPQVLAKFQGNGAFEVYLDDGLAFSKLETGRMPSQDDLVQPLLAAGLQRAATE
jgi:selT/selW/selH-like putative selenoprotein